MSEYSIFLDEETSTLFAFQKVSVEGGSQDLANNAIVKKMVGFCGRYHGGTPLITHQFL